MDPMTVLAAQLKAQGEMLAQLQEQMRQSSEQNAKLMETNATLMAQLNRPAKAKAGATAEQTPDLSDAEIKEREQKAAWSALCEQLGIKE